jgi:hypothetical protein
MEQAPALHAVFMEPNVKKAIDIKMLLSFEEQELIEKVVKLLEPFKRLSYYYFIEQIRANIPSRNAAITEDGRTPN